jgi:hypothetical protein
LYILVLFIVIPAKLTSFAAINLQTFSVFLAMQYHLSLKKAGVQHHKTFYRFTVYFVCALLLLLLFTACSKQNYYLKPAYAFKSADGNPDYSSLNYWAAHPWKQDLSDSVPASLAALKGTDSLADVFFVYPTTLISKKDFEMNAAIDNKAINAKTDYSSILYQASAFNNNCRVFAPRYRQAHYRAFFLKTPEAVNAFNLAYDDVKTAFDYYLKHYNAGRPIIIASHSQGTVHTARLLKEYFENKPLQKKLVCAYLIGMPIPDSYFTAIKPCADSTATGCFVSWRTYKKGYTEQIFVAKETFKAVVVNPLTWKQDEQYAPLQLNSGSILKNFTKLKTGVVDAQVHGNVLWVCKPKFFGNFLITTKNYHIADINLFYNNIRQNLAARIKAYNNR